MFTRHYAHWPQGLPKQIEFPRRSVYANLAQAMGRHSARVAIDFYGTRISYAELHGDVLRLAGFLQQRCGVRKGDRVLLDVQNSPQFVVGYFAALRADAVVVPVNTMNRTEELRHYVEDSGARVAIAGQDIFAELQPLIGARRLERVIKAVYSDYLRTPTDLPVPGFVLAPRIEGGDAIAWKEALAANCVPGEHTACAEDLAVMPYTSGTTGQPKGCMHTHANVQATATAYLEWRGGPTEPVVLTALPMFHVTGMQAGMNAPLNAGATLVVLARWDRDCAAMQIERARVTNWSAITTMLVDFLSNPRLDDYDLSSLQVLGGGGAAMPEALAAKLEQAFGLKYVEGYGLSETMAPTHINPPQRPKRQCGGIPIFNTDARVLEVGTQRELGVAEVGEIVVHGPQVFQGYWKQPEATAQAFILHDGKRFFRTGDLGYYDEDGYFFITDRLKRMINASGYKVWPAEVEAMLYHHADVREACVIGTQDARRGETVKAVVVLRDESRGKISPEDIIAWSRGKMAAYKVPRVIEFVDALPKSGTGKVQWRLLQENENKKIST
jgi:fatty-acyl-CoA synthase